MRGRRGSVFILAVWATAFTALLALAVASRTAAVFRTASDVRDRVLLRGASMTAVKKAQAYLSRTGDGPESLKDEWSGGNPRAFRDLSCGTVRYDYLASGGRYGFVDEESKVPLNSASEAVLARLLQAAGGLAPEDARRLAQAAVDWRDADSFAVAGGAEDVYHGSRERPFFPRNAPFKALEELRLLPGVDAALYARIAPFLTLHGRGKINVNTAGWEALTASGLDPSLARKIVRFRAGRDGVPGTPDDVVITDPAQTGEQMRFDPGLTLAEQLQLASAATAGRLTADSDHFTIVVEARQGKRRQRIACVTDRRYQILEWRE